MAEGINVFFSYSHKDEQLRDELAKHLSILQWQGVIESWHDRKITAGDDWAGKIDEQLNTAQIILLLISPDFMASRYCYDIEMKRAVARHDAGEARVIPVILRPSYWKGAPFGKLQALPKDAKPVTSWSNVDEAFVNIVESIQAAIESMNAKGAAANPTVEKPVPAKKEPPTHIVDQMHRGDFVTISTAIAAAKPGDRILVRPGLYQEGFIIDKPLEIIGDGERDEIVVQAKDQNVVLFQTTRGRVANLTLRQLGGGNWFCINIAQGRLDLEECDISSQSLAGVAIHDGADPRVRRNRIHDGKTSGIYIYENGQGAIEDNEIVGNVKAGVSITTGGNPVVRRNRIRDGKGNGIIVYENGQGMIEDNEIVGNVMPGIAITTGGNPVVRRNRIRDGKGAGVRVTDGGQGAFEDNEIVGNALPGVATDNGGNPTIRRNHISKNHSVGVKVYDNGSGTFEDNDLRDNAKGAWEIDATSLPNVVRRNNIEDEE